MKHHRNGGIEEGFIEAAKDTGCASETDINHLNFLRKLPRNRTDLKVKDQTFYYSDGHICENLYGNPVGCSMNRLIQVLSETGSTPKSNLTVSLS